MPVITSLVKQKKKANRVNLFIDHDFYCGLSLETVMKEGLKKGRQVDDDYLESIKLKDIRINARESALRLLEFRARSRQELFNRLRQKEVPQPVIDEVLDNLEKTGLINDEAFAKMVIHDLKLKNMGRRRMVQECLVKGLSKQLVEQVMMEYEDANELESCLEAGRKKVGSYQRLELVTAKRRLTAFLIRRGFKHQDVYHVVNELLEDNQ